ncbi:MAG: glycosyl transferase, partial [Anaerolineales bacterium]
LYAALTVSPLLWAVGVLAGVVYIRTPLRRMGGLWGGLSSGQKLRALLWVPIIRIAGDCAKMAGYPVGWLRRMRRV